jgi:isocitrate dehydrogenase (NAD+)
MILSAVLMLNYLGEREIATRILEAVKEVIKEGQRVTYDLGGSYGTLDMAKAIVEKLETN